MIKTISFDLDHYIKEEPVIIYGASVYGELAYIALHQMGITPTYYCDRSKKRARYFDIDVIGPEDLGGFKNANIIIASADFFYEIKESLEKIGCKNIFDMTYLLKLELPREKMTNRALEMYENRQHYMDLVKNQSGDRLVFNRVQYVVTEKCSLRCRDCSHLIQYYHKPQNIDLEQYKPAFDVLLENVDYIAELRILGGEPFVNKQMYKLIEWYQDSEKIQSISIYTNGTIIPDEVTLKALQDEKVKVHVSDYGINQSKIKELAEIFDKHNIVYFVRKYDSWQDAGGVEYRNYSLEQKESIFSTCFERNGFTFLKGQLHRCPRSAHAMNLRVMPDVKEDYVDLLNWNGTREELTVQLRKLQEMTWLEACNYCGGPDNHIQGIPAAQQITKPIDYNEVL